MTYKFKTTTAMRTRLRELSNTDGKDDYDRVVIMLLDDFDAMVNFQTEAKDCQKCKGDCSFANPPVYDCPLNK